MRRAVSESHGLFCLLGLFIGFGACARAERPLADAKEQLITDRPTAENTTKEYATAIRLGELTTLQRPALPRARMDTPAAKFEDAAFWARKAGNFAEAKTYIERVVEFDKKSNDSAILATSYHHLSLVERDLGNFNEMKRAVELAIREAEGEVATTHPELLVFYNTLASAERNLGNVSEAKRLINLGIQKAEYGDPVLYECYFSLALLERELKQASEARRLMKDIIAVEDKLEADPDARATSIAQLALIEEDLNNLDEAKRLLHDAIAIRQANVARTFRIGYDLFSLARVEKKLGHLDESRRLSKRAIEYQKRRLKPDDPIMADCYKALALTELELDNRNEAKVLLLQALQIQDERFESGNPELADTYVTLSRVEGLLGNQSESRKLSARALVHEGFHYANDERDRDVDRALKIADELLKADPVDPYALTVKACAMAANKEFDLAIELQEKALKDVRYASDRHLFGGDAALERIVKWRRHVPWHSSLSR